MKPLFIAVTGVIGSGKSSVARGLACLLKAEHCDTDAVCRDLLEKGNKGWQSVVDKWGNYYLDGRKNIDRAKLREEIFNSDEIRKDLEAILHPLVRQHVLSLKGKCQDSEIHLVVEVPLLFESGWQGDFDSVIVVFADRETCLQRTILRDGVSIGQAEKSINSQIDIMEKVKLADNVIDNSGSRENTIFQVKELVDTFMKS